MRVSDLSPWLCGTLLLVLPGSAQKAAPGCSTPLGVPCYTVRFIHTQWRFFRRGISDFGYFSEHRTAAARGDGSIYWDSDWESYSLRRAGRSESAAFYLAPEDQVVRVFPRERTYSTRPPAIWHDRPYRHSAAGDATCRTGILHHGTDFRQVGESTVAGLQVVEWARSNGNNGTDQVWLAPSLDCLTLKSRSTFRNFFGIPTFIDDAEAVSVDLGEPDPSLFAIPSDFRKMEDPALPGLRRFLEYQRRFSRP